MPALKPARFVLVYVLCNHHDWNLDWHIYLTSPRLRFIPKCPRSACTECSGPARAAASFSCFAAIASRAALRNRVCSHFAEWCCSWCWACPLACPQVLVCIHDTGRQAGSCAGVCGCVAAHDAGLASYRFLRPKREGCVGVARAQRGARDNRAPCSRMHDVVTPLTFWQSAVHRRMQ